MMNINELVKEIIEEKIDINDKILSNEDYFEEVTGVLQCDLLKKLVAKSYRSKRIREILGQILYYSDSGTISNEIFSEIIDYRYKKVRKNCLIALGHCPISFYQLMYINSLKIGTEAFAQLFHIMCYNDIFSEFDILYLLNLSRYIDNLVIQNCIISVLNEQKLSKRKNEFLVDMLHKY